MTTTQTYQVINLGIFSLVNKIAPEPAFLPSGTVGYAETEPGIITIFLRKNNIVLDLQIPNHFSSEVDSLPITQQQKESIRKLDSLPLRLKFPAILFQIHYNTIAKSIDRYRVFMAGQPLQNTNVVCGPFPFTPQRKQPYQIPEEFKFCGTIVDGFIAHYLSHFTSETVFDPSTYLKVYRNANVGIFSNLLQWAFESARDNVPYVTFEEGRMFTPLWKIMQKASPQDIKFLVMERIEQYTKIDPDALVTDQRHNGFVSLYDVNPLLQADRRDKHGRMIIEEVDNETTETTEYVYEKGCLIELNEEPSRPIIKNLYGEVIEAGGRYFFQPEEDRDIAFVGSVKSIVKNQDETYMVFMGGFPLRVKDGTHRISKFAHTNFHNGDCLYEIGKEYAIYDPHKTGCVPFTKGILVGAECLLTNTILYKLRRGRKTLKINFNDYHITPIEKMENLSPGEYIYFGYPIKKIRIKKGDRAYRYGAHIWIDTTGGKKLPQLEVCPIDDPNALPCPIDQRGKLGYLKIGDEVLIVNEGFLTTVNRATYEGFDKGFVTVKINTKRVRTTLHSFMERIIFPVNKIDDLEIGDIVKYNPPAHYHLSPFNRSSSHTIIQLFQSCKVNYVFLSSEICYRYQQLNSHWFKVFKPSHPSFNRLRPTQTVVAGTLFETKFRRKYDS